MTRNVRVLFDHQVFSIQLFGGVSEYFYHLISALRMEKDFSVSVSARYSNNIFAPEAAGSSPFFSLPNVIHWRGVGRADQFLRRIGLLVDVERMNNRASQEQIRGGGCDVFHPTYYDDYFLEALGDRPYVVTVYDMTHEILSEHFPSADSFLAKKRAVIDRASAVIAISESTKADLVRLYDVPAERVVVSHLGGPDDADQLDECTEKDYVLFVGHRSGYKNFTLFLEAIAPILRAHRDLRLVCAGSHPFTRKERGQMRMLGIEARVEHKAVKGQGDFRRLYSEALVFVFPSKYEGFGLPLLAALSYGCPVACSSCASFPEIAGDAAAYFQPDNREQMSAAIATLIDSASLRKERRAAGRERSRRFSWSRCASEHMHLYRQLQR